MEEAGINVEVNGIVRLEHTPVAYGTRCRLIVNAEQICFSDPKSEKDEETLEAAWFTIEEMKSLNLRKYEIINIFEYVKSGGMIGPISMLAKEGECFFSN